MTIATAYSWVTSTAAIQGTKDSWDFTQKTPLQEDDQATFVTQAIHAVLTNLIPSYNPLLLNSYLSPQQQASIDSVKTAGNFSAWLTAWQTWWVARSQDGSVAAAAFPDPSTLPNGSTFLEVSQSQDITAYPNPTQWTPLSINGVQKKYLTATWNSVRSTCLTAQQETTTKTLAAQYKLSGAEREAELADLFLLTQTLNDQKKIIAEFWAGGPGTPAPPGIAIWMWRQAVRNQSSYTIVYSGLELAIALFEASRLVWGLKFQFKEARPIQEFRRMYSTKMAILYDGSIVPTNLWVPNQASNFVTPPFPDFCSGHSAFSQSFANVMTTWFGPDIPSDSFSTANANILSPVFQANQPSFSLRSFTVSKGTSEIQPGVVPAVPLTLTFQTWQDMAESAGISRQYGGIHCQSAHLGGQVVANGVTEAVRTVWDIQLSA